MDEPVELSVQFEWIESEWIEPNDAGISDGELHAAWEERASSVSSALAAPPLDPAMAAMLKSPMPGPDVFGTVNVDDASGGHIKPVLSVKATH